jgi:glycosyltransferase involved in cell wall biosynthesis
VVRRVRAYDAVHAHWALPQGLVSVLATARVPVVVTVHGGDVFALDQGPMRAAKRLAFRRAAAVTVNSSATERAVRALATPRRLVRIPMGIEVDPPVDEALVRRIRAEHGGAPLVALVGRVVEEKGVFDLIAAADRLRSDLRVVVLGEGQDRTRAEAEVQRLGLEEHVRFVGWVDPADVPAWLAAADIVAAPSRTAPDGWAEAQGLSIVEAMAARRPVVTTASGGIGDALEHEVTGLVVGEGRPDELADAIRRLHDDPALAARLADAGRVRAVDGFSADASADAFVSLFEEVCR